MIEPSHYSTVEKISYIVIDLRDIYVSDHGDFHEWDELTDELFFMNCEINILHALDVDGLLPNPVSKIYGLSRGITAIHFNKDSYYHKVEHRMELSFEELEVSYEEMLCKISEFVFG